MKKSIVAVALIVAVGLGLSAVSAFAWTCGGPGGGYGRGWNARAGAGIEYNDAEYQKFLKESVDIRRSIAADRAELNAVMAGTNPDPKRVRELTESLTANQEKLAEMAQTANIDAPAGCGYGANTPCSGPGRGGYGAGNCAGPGRGGYGYCR